MLLLFANAALPWHCSPPATLQEGRSGKVEVFLTAADGAPNPTPPPIYPTAGTHLVPLKRVSDAAARHLLPVLYVEGRC